MGEFIGFIMYAVVALIAVGALYFMRLFPILPIVTLMLLSRVLFDGVNKFSIAGVSVTSLLGAALLGIAVGMVMTGLAGMLAFASTLVLLFFSNLQAQAGFGVELGDEFIRFASVLGVFFIMRNLRSMPSRESILLIIQLMGLVSAFFSVLQFITGTGMQIQGLTRIAGAMAHPNSAGLLYAMALTASTISLLAGISRKRSWFFSLLFGAVLLLTGSVGGVIAAVVMLTSYGLLAYRVPKRVRSVTIGIVVVTVLGFALSPLGETRLGELSSLDLSSASESNSLEWRLGRWNDILLYWRESPLIGQGFGSSTKGAMLNGYPPHNEYVRALVEIGILGFLLVAAFVWFSMRRIRQVAKQPSNDPVILGLTLAVLIGMLINGLSENTFMYSVPAYVLAMLLGLLWKRASSCEAQKFANPRIMVHSRNALP